MPIFPDQKINKKTINIIFFQVIGKLLSLGGWAYFISFTAKNLQKDQFGIFTLCVSALVLFGILSIFGQNQ